MSDNSSSNLSEKDLLFKVYEKLVRMEEKWIALTDANKKDHDFLTDKYNKLESTIKDQARELSTLKTEGVKLSIFWKFVTVGVPIIISIAIAALYKILGW